MSLEEEIVRLRESIDRLAALLEDWTTAVGLHNAFRKEVEGLLGQTSRYQTNCFKGWEVQG